MTVVNASRKPISVSLSGVLPIISNFPSDQTARSFDKIARQRAQNSAQVSGLGLSATSRSIGEPLSLGTDQGACRAVEIIDAERGAVVVPEIELGEVAVKVRLANVEIAAVNPALQNRKEILGGVGVGVASHVFVLAVRDSFMAGEQAADMPVVVRLVGAEVAREIDVLDDDRAQGRGSDIGGMKRANPPVTLDQGENRSLALSAAPPGALG